MSKLKQQMYYNNQKGKNFLKILTTLKANPTPKINMSSACTHEYLGGKEKTSLENKVEKKHHLRIKNIGKITYE